MTIDTLQIKKLFELYKLLKNKNDSLKTNGVNDYSLLHSVLKIHDEVRLHSGFIYSMINPKSRHYLGSHFLLLFLKQFINDDDLKELLKTKKGGISVLKNNIDVFKERDNIDLLIHFKADPKSNEKYYIIENKLNALDQKNQISRYIHTVIKDYGAAPENIRVIYLSHKKKKPASQSYKGFLIKDNNLEWLGGELELNNKAKLNFDDKKIKIPFYSIDYLNNMVEWVNDCKTFLASQHPITFNIFSAFEEYQLILKKMDRAKFKFKVESLVDFTLGLSPSNQESMLNLMYQSNIKDEPTLKEFNKKGIDKKLQSKFIAELKKSLTKYLSEKTYQMLYENFPTEEYDIITDKNELKEKFDSDYPDAKISIIKDGENGINSFNVSNINNWIEHKRNCNKNIFFLAIHKETDKPYLFCLATKYVYFSTNLSIKYFGNKKISKPLFEYGTFTSKPTVLKDLEEKLQSIKNK